MKDKKMNIEEYQVDDMDIDFDDIKIMIYKNKVIIAVVIISNIFMFSRLRK